MTVLPKSCVVYDSDAATGALAGAFVNTTRTIQVTGPLPADQGVGTLPCVPTTATAVVVTISALDPQGLGNLRLSEAGVVANGGVVNYQANDLDNANTVTVPLSPSGEVDIYANAGLTGARLLVLGYYSNDGTLTYTPLPPCAVADSRTTIASPASAPYTGPVAVGSPHPDIDVVGTVPAGQGGNPGGTDCGVPATADAVVVNLVSINTTGGSGFLATTASSNLDPFQPTTPFASIPLNNATSTVIPLNGGETIAIDVEGDPGSTSHIRVVVLGYLDDTAGDSYTPVNPCAAFDSRTTIPGDTNVPSGTFAGKRTAGSANINLTGVTTYNVTGAVPAAQGGELDCNVPDGATAVLINLVGIQPDSIGNFRAYATGSTPTGGVLNFNALTPAMNNSNAIAVPLSAAGDLDLFVNAPSMDGSPTIHARGVILGYYN